MHALHSTSTDGKQRLGEAGGYEIVHSSPGSRSASTCSWRPSPTASSRMRTTRSTSSSRAAACSTSRATQVDLREGHALFVPAGAEHRFSGYEQLSLLVIFERSTCARPCCRGARAAPDRRLLARRELPLGRADLPARQPAPARAAAARARQAAAARPLRHDAGAEPRLRAPEPRDPRPRPERDLHHRPRARRPGLVANAYLEGTYSELYPHDRPTTRTGCASSSASSRSRAGSRATPRRRRPARSTRAASSATRSRTPSARRSTTPTCSSPASSATARPRPGRSRRAGTRTSS